MPDYVLPDHSCDVLELPSPREFKSFGLFCAFLALALAVSEAIQPSAFLRFLCAFIILALISAGVFWQLARHVRRRVGPNPPMSALLIICVIQVAVFGGPIVGVGGLVLKAIAASDAEFSDYARPLAYSAAAFALLSPAVEVLWRHWQLNSLRRYHKQVQDASDTSVSQCAVQQISELERIAFTDALTGLPNRRHFERGLEEAARSSALSAAPAAFAVMFLDFDKFKQINDVHGHAIGDEFLIAVASRISALLRKGDLAARLGGDEFAILLTGETAQAAAISLADRIVQAMSQPLQLTETCLRSSASIGIASSEGASVNPNEVVHAADLAMYQAKKAGGGRYALAGMGEGSDVLLQTA